MTRARALRRRLTSLTAVAVAFIAAFSSAAAQSGAPRPLPAESYTRENWTVADGLPINSITALLQTRDGYLWLGTNDGVVRFDGVRFTVYNAGNTPELPSNRITALHEDRAGALWILTEQQHLVRYLRGRFTHIDANRGLRGGALGLTELPDGTLMLTTTRGAGILKDESFTPLVDSLEMESGYGGAVRRRDGTTWIATRRHGLWRVTNGRLEDITPPALRRQEFLRITLDAQGRLWLSDTSGVWIEDGGFRDVRRPDGPVKDVVSFRYDAHGNRMWMLGEDGVDVSAGTIATNSTRFTGLSSRIWPTSKNQR